MPWNRATGRVAGRRPIGGATAISLRNPAYPLSFLCLPHGHATIRPADAPTCSGGRSPGDTNRTSPRIARINPDIGCDWICTHACNSWSRWPFSPGDLALGVCAQLNPLLSPAKKIVRPKSPLQGSSSRSPARLPTWRPSPGRGGHCAETALRRPPPSPLMNSPRTTPTASSGSGRSPSAGTPSSGLASRPPSASSGLGPPLADGMPSCGLRGGPPCAAGGFVPASPPASLGFAG